MPKYTFHYFGSRARGEVIRWILNYTEADWTEVTIAFPDWPNLKKNTDVYPMGQVPVLYQDGRAITQTNAILRHLAREFDLYGGNNVDRSQIDIHFENVCDIHEKFVIPLTVKGVISGKTAIPPELLAQFPQYTVQGWKSKAAYAEQVLPDFQRAFGAFAARYEKLVGKGWLVGNKISLADFFLAEVLDRTGLMFEGLLKPYPNLQAHMDKVKSLPTLKAHIQKRA